MDGSIALARLLLIVGLAKAALRVSGMRLKTTEKITATPSVPPIWRKKVDEDVATPMSRGPTAFWLAIVSVCIIWPRPRPTRSMAAASTQ